MGSKTPSKSKTPGKTPGKAKTPSKAPDTTHSTGATPSKTPGKSLGKSGKLAVEVRGTESVKRKSMGGSGTSGPGGSASGRKKGRV